MSQKLKFVLSDLHLGVDYATSGNGPVKEFTAATELVNFLHEILHESEHDGCEVELIINGDMFAFLQVPAVDKFDPAKTYPIEAYLDSSQEAFIKRLNIVVSFHPDIFNALSDFIHVEIPQRRVTLIKGNHDVGLYWPGVKGRLREILGASGTRASLLRFADEFVSREKIYVEHGHQRAERMNGYRDSFDPRSTDDPSQLYYPTGSRFIIDFFNQVKADRWYVGHIKPLTTLIWYALEYDFEFACQALAEFIKHTPALVINHSFDRVASPIHPGNQLLHKLEDPTQRAHLAQRYAADIDLRRQLHRQIWSYLEDAVIDNRGEIHLPPADISASPIKMGTIDQQRQQVMLHKAAQTIVNSEGSKIVLFGHTHQPIQERLENGGEYINTGSWIEDFSDASPETWQALFRAELAPRKPRFLPYARIDYDDVGNPTAKLLNFGPEPDIPTNSIPIDSTETVEPTGFFDRVFQLFGAKNNDDA